jgi:signal transduction histidine kinase
MPDRGKHMHKIEPPAVTREGAELSALRLENEKLAGQVKRLVKAEGRLYEYQEQLDVQLKEYQELYELNRKLIASPELRSIFESATEYVINKLGYERVIFFQRSENSDAYTISALDGYYEQQEKSAVAKLALLPDSPVLSLPFVGGEYLICQDDSMQHALAEFRAKIRMNEYLLFRLGSSPQPLALLAIGNTAGKAEFYRRVSDHEGGLLGIGNLVGLLSPTIVRKRDEDEIRHLNAKLKQKIVQLQEVQEELVRQEKLSILGQLSGSVGHELRNPLGVMSNAVYYLQMVLPDADETTKEYLGIIKKEIDNCLRIITDLLDFARTRPPKRTLAAVPTLVSQSLGQCAVPENIAVALHLTDILPKVNVDPLQMEQVLQNIITNAIQAMPAGGTLTIIGAENPEAGLVRLSISDTGAGISPEHRKKLFQPLFTTKARGIGLGLVVCKNLVAANGGTIEVESAVGEGTTFAVVLTAEKGESHA